MEQLENIFTDHDLQTEEHNTTCLGDITFGNGQNERIWVDRALHT